MNTDSSSLNPAKVPIRVIVSLDVEEEGLFSGRYPCRNCSTSNVERIAKLAPLSQELGFPLTLFCSYAVLSQASCLRTLEYMKSFCGAEIGAHLHHWSTPPFDSCQEALHTAPQRTDAMRQDLLEQKLSALLKIGADFNAAPIKSFRMGRWDIKAKLFPLLSQLGIKADSSICPLRSFSKGANHFLSPQTPYWALGRDVPFLEVPVTQIPLFPWLSKAWYATTKGTSLLDSFHFFGALSANPFWHKDFVARLCVRLFHIRKLPVLSIFWHSSEMLPGASPHVPTEKAAEDMLKRLFSFFSWLRQNFNVKGVTLGDLFDEEWAKKGKSAFPSPQNLMEPCGDCWQSQL